MNACPNCGCPHMHTGGYRTADAQHAWQDEDGTWHCGPAEEEIRTACANPACGWRLSVSKRRGKEISRVEVRL